MLDETMQSLSCGMPKRPAHTASTLAGAGRHALMTDPFPNLTVVLVAAHGMRKHSYWCAGLCSVAYWPPWLHRGVCSNCYRPLRRQCEKSEQPNLIKDPAASCN